MISLRDFYVFLERFNWDLPVYEETTELLGLLASLTTEHNNLYKAYYSFILNEGPKPEVYNEDVHSLFINSDTTA